MPNSIEARHEGRPKNKSYRRRCVAYRYDPKTLTLIRLARTELRKIIPGATNTDVNEVSVWGQHGHLIPPERWPKHLLWLLRSENTPPTG